MSMRQIYCPDNVWILSFNGFGSNPDAEPVRLCHRTRREALEDFGTLAEQLKAAYPDAKWSEDTEIKPKKIDYKIEMVGHPGIFAEAHRVRFLDGGCLFWEAEDRGIRQDELTLFAKGYKLK